AELHALGLIEPQSGEMSMTQNSPHAERRIFISYARADADFANQLVADLEIAGHDCWIDTRDIKAGEKWGDAIGEAIRDSYAFIPIITQAALESENVLDEIQVAKDNKREIIPFVWSEDLLNDLRFSRPLKRYNAVTLFNSDYKTVALPK